MADADRKGWRLVTRLLSDPEEMLAATEADLQTQQPGPDQLAAVDLRLAELRQERERVVRAIRRGRIPDDLADRELAEIDGTEREQKAVRQALLARSTPDWRPDADSLVRVAQERLASRVDPATQREILRLLARRIIANRGGAWEAEWAFVPQSIEPGT